MFINPCQIILRFVVSALIWFIIISFTSGNWKCLVFYYLIMSIWVLLIVNNPIQIVWYVIFIALIAWQLFVVLNRMLIQRCNVWPEKLVNPAKCKQVSFPSIAALFFSSKSSRHSTSLCQQQATGRHEYLDRRAEGRLFQSLPPRSKNIWRQASKFTSGEFSQKTLGLITYHRQLWKILVTMSLTVLLFLRG